MNLRRDRRHQAGHSNSDYIALSKQECARPDTIGTIDYLSLPKKKTLQDILLKRNRHIQTAPHPIEQTQTMYKNHGKTQKFHPKLDNPRFHQLEEIEKRKWAFTGDSYATLDPHPANKSLIRRFTQSNSKLEYDGRTHGLSKKEDNQRAILETQQIA